MRTVLQIALVMWATGATAHHDMTPLREAVIDGHNHAVGGATVWLVVAAVAMLIALFAVQKAVFRKK
ncbi:MAG: hypothetical protein KAS85_11660 [Rhodobacteraceae bacterium]|nr:hypothetical protein [Paracoccaceae bacterium]